MTETESTAVQPTTDAPVADDPLTPRGSKPRFLGKGSPSRRRIGAILIVVSVVLAPLSILSLWAKNTVTNTDRYVETVAPLAKDPNIQAAITNKLSARIDAKVNVNGFVERVLPQQLHGLAGPIESATDTFIHSAVSRVVQSNAFYTIWVDANRLAHKQLLRLLQGPTAGGASNGKVTLDLSAVISDVKKQLSDHGFTALNGVPTDRIDATITFWQSPAVKHVQAGFNLLQSLGDWLPVIGIAALAGGLWLSPHRRKSVFRAGLGFVAAMIITLVLLLLAQNFYLNHVPPDVFPRPAAAAAFTVLTRFLHESIWAFGLFSLFAALFAAFLGPSRATVSTRSFLSRTMIRSGDWVEAKRILPNGLRKFVERRRFLIQIAIVVIMAGLAIYEHSIEAVLIFALVIILLLLLVEFLRSGSAAPIDASEPETPQDEQVLPTGTAT
jgi:hypothetical protein